MCVCLFFHALLLDDKKETAYFSRQFERSKIEWLIRRDKIFFPDAFEGRERLGSTACRGRRRFERHASHKETSTSMKVNKRKLIKVRLQLRKEAERKLHSSSLRYIRCGLVRASLLQEAQLNQFDFYFPLHRFIVLLLAGLKRAEATIMRAIPREKSSSAIR